MSIDIMGAKAEAPATRAAKAAVRIFSVECDLVETRHFQNSRISFLPFFVGKGLALYAGVQPIRGSQEVQRDADESRTGGGDRRVRRRLPLVRAGQGIPLTSDCCWRQATPFHAGCRGLLLRDLQLYESKQQTAQASAPRFFLHLSLIHI